VDARSNDGVGASEMTEAWRL